MAYFDFVNWVNFGWYILGAFAGSCVTYWLGKI